MKVEIHRIARCGFYARRQPQALFGHAPDWSAAFGEWISQRPNVAATTSGGLLIFSLLLLLNTLLGTLLPVAHLQRKERERRTRAAYRR